MGLDNGRVIAVLAVDGGQKLPSLVQDYAYDHLNRLSKYRALEAGTVTDSSTYGYDALDRVVEQTEQHGGEFGPVERTTFTHLGLSGMVTGEQRDHSVEGITDKTYTYDTYGTRIAMTSQADGAPERRFTYGYDVHGSVSLLLDEAASVTASYGYTAYGTPDEELTEGDDAEPGLLNPYRYSAKRYDTGSATLDMGARRFGPDTSRFLQQDLYRGALADMSLTLDPLTQNRYALAGGNPVSYIETDGHRPIPNGDGTAGSYKLDHTRDRVEATEYWANALDVDAVTLAITLEHESWHTRAGHGPLVEMFGYRDSLGVGSVRLETARARLADTFGAEYASDSYELRYKMVQNIDFNVAVAAAHLKYLEREHGLTGRDAFVAYAFNDTTVQRLAEADFQVGNLPDEIRLSNAGRRVGPVRIPSRVLLLFSHATTANT